MASIMNSGDAGSYTSAYEFELGQKVKIDGRRKGTMVICIRLSLMERISYSQSGPSD